MGAATALALTGIVIVIISLVVAFSRRHALSGKTALVIWGTYLVGMLILIISVQVAYGQGV